MSDAAQQQYTDLLMELLKKRDAAGGSVLSVAEEDRYLDELDKLWYAMSKDERDAVERRFRCEP